MTIIQEKIKRTSEDMLYLIGCILHEIVPDKKRVLNMDLECLYQVSNFHTMPAIVYMALEKVDIFSGKEGELKRKWQEEKNKAIRKNILLDAERTKLFSWMEEKGIWHMPLKGAILKDFYPEIGMRQMADNDILFDEKYRQDTWKYMEDNGYKATYGGNHDVYEKPPVYKFELHMALFGKSYHPKWVEYYASIKKRLLLVENTLCEYRFTDEDFYIYLMAHEYKHYDSRGTGIRSLLDCYIYNREKGRQLNREYVKKELEQLGISSFESEMRSLSEKLFSNPNEFSWGVLTKREREILEYRIFSGVHGTSENWVRKNLEKFENTDRFKILLSHIPEGLLLWKSMERWDVDLVFSGHVHGGQIRVPFVGGLFDPEEGFFPTYTKGMFQCGDGTMILSAGLGSSGMIPRVNNLPEITVCEIGNEGKFGEN